MSAAPTVHTFVQGRDIFVNFSLSPLVFLHECAHGNMGCAPHTRANNLTDYTTVAAALSAEQNKYRAVWKCQRLLGTFPTVPHSVHLRGPAHCSPATITLIGCSKRTGKCSGRCYLRTEAPEGNCAGRAKQAAALHPEQRLFLWTVPVHLEALFPPQHCSQKRPLVSREAFVIHLTLLTSINLGNSAPVWRTRCTAAPLIKPLSAVEPRLNRGVTSLPLLGYAKETEEEESALNQIHQTSSAPCLSG